MNLVFIKTKNKMILTIQNFSYLPLWKVISIILVVGIIFSWLFYFVVLAEFSVYTAIIFSGEQKINIGTFETFADAEEAIDMYYENHPNQEISDWKIISTFVNPLKK